MSILKPQTEVDGRWFSFSTGWLWGSMLIFQEGSQFLANKFQLEELSDKENPYLSWQLTHLIWFFSLKESKKALKPATCFHPPGKPHSTDPIPKAFYAWFLWWKLGRAICQVSNGTWALKLMMLTHHAPWLDQEFGNHLLGKMQDKCLGFRWILDGYV